MKFESAQQHFSILVPSNSVEAWAADRDSKGNPQSFYFLAGGSAQAFVVFGQAIGPSMTDTDSKVADETIKGLIAGMNEAAKRDGEYDRILTIKSGRELHIEILAGKQ